MNKEDLINRVNNPNNIPGIYNYCDRWCERCNFTSKCANYSISDEQFSGEDMDLKNEKFWNKLSEIFQITMEMLVEKAEEMGIDLKDLDDMEDDEFKEREEKRDKIIVENESVALSKKYYNIVTEWFKSVQSIFDEKDQEWKTKLKLGLPIEDNDEINDIAEVIRWYQYQINVKLIRATKGKIDEKEDYELREEFPKDSDGSAKVALIGVDRSISSWGKMLQHFPQLEDEILPILVILKKLQRLTEEEFPEARSFKRIGFDDL